MRDASAVRDLDWRVLGRERLHPRRQEGADEDGHSSLTMTARYADKANMRRVKQDYDTNSPVAALGLKAPRLVRVV